MKLKLSFLHRYSKMKLLDTVHPGIWTEDQVRQWKLVTDAVHGRGGAPRILVLDIYSVELY